MPWPSKDPEDYRKGQPEPREHAHSEPLQAPGWVKRGGSAVATALVDLGRDLQAMVGQDVPAQRRREAGIPPAWPPSKDPADYR